MDHPEHGIRAVKGQIGCDTAQAEAPNRMPMLLDQCLTVCLGELIGCTPHSAGNKGSAGRCTAWQIGWPQE